MLNNDEYIDSVLALPEFENQGKYLKLSIRMNIRTLFYSWKWLLYIIIGLLPLLFTIFAKDKLLGQPDAISAFINAIISNSEDFNFYLTLLTFGCLLIAQPLSTDEISDHMIDLQLVRPIKREIIWTSRFIVVNIGAWLVNMIILTIYYIFYHIVDPNHTVWDIFNLNHIGLLIYAYIFVLLASLCYSGIFLFVGLIGKRGFSLGVMLAVFESFFLNLLFLADSRYMPRTHLENIAGTYFDPTYVYQTKPVGLTPLLSYLYVLGLMLASYLLGIWYLRRREFN